MSNIFAAIGRVQLSRFEKEFAPKRRHIAKRYTELLQSNKNVKLIHMDYDTIVPHIFPIEILNGKRDALTEQFKEHDIQYGIQYRPNHLLSYFKAPYQLPVTEDVYSKIISIPMHPELSDEDIKLICSIINNL
jgi:dTDP-4-amino-4,6-dideoxygalactose transaminase